MSRGAGLVLALDASLLLFPVCRNLMRFVQQITNKWIHLDQPLDLHKWTAYSLLFFTMVHVNAHYTNFFLVEQKLKLVETWQVHYKTWAGLSGHLMVIIMLLMYTSAKKEIRKAKFELFFSLHHLYFPFYFLLFFHAFGCFVKSADTAQCKGYNTAYFALAGFCFYLLERLIRAFRVAQPTHLVAVKRHAGNVIEIQYEKPSLHYQPGQYIYIQFPQISHWQWHPFTLTSCPEEGVLSIHMSVVGGWTQKVESFLCNRHPSRPKIRVDGPFGAPAQYVYAYKFVVLIAAGIGVTPAASILKSIWFKANRHAPLYIQKIHFYWICRKKEAFSWFQELLAQLEETFPTNILQIHIYLTEHLDVDDVEYIVYSDLYCPQDPITNLMSKSCYGRPKWEQEFDLWNMDSLNCISHHHPLYGDGSALFRPSLDVVKKGTTNDHHLYDKQTSPETSFYSSTVKPNFSLISEKSVKVGIFTCAPHSLSNQVQKECIKRNELNQQSKTPVQFELRKEQF